MEHSINEYYSVEEKGWICDLKWQALRDHAEAKLRGQKIGKLGENNRTIPTAVADAWVGWICLDGEDQRNPPANRKHLEKRDNFGLSLKKPAAFEFIKAAAEENPDQEWDSL